jgi:hypothetical protein
VDASADEAERPSVLAVVEVGHAVDDDGRLLPTASIDVGEHPEIADLARVHAIEGIGDLRTHARRISGPSVDLVLVGVALTRPVRAAFAVAFTLPEHRAFLDEVAKAGTLVLATTDPTAAHRDRPVWLAIDVDGHLLAAQLTADQGRGRPSS